MKVTWDAKAKAVYIHLPHKGWGINDHTAEINDQLYLDYNNDGEVIGIEILNTTQPIVEELK